MIISSVNNEKIKEIRKLKNSKYAEEKKMFLIEGDHLVKEAYSCGFLIETISAKEVNYGVPNTIVTSNVIKSLSTLSTPPDIIGICKFTNENKKLGNRVIILDGVQDPGNLGTIIRSSVAFGFTSIVLSPNCVKKHNEKVIRATQGMIFKTNVITANLEELIPELISDGYEVYGTDVKEGVNVKEIKSRDKIAIVMGSEGSGVSLEVKKLVSGNIYINMNNNCESLNVAVAASILMYELQK